jgi:hypothetical protein
MRSSIAAAVVVILSACSGARLYGVQRGAMLSTFPDPNCVRAVVEAVSGPERIREWHLPQHRDERGSLIDGRKHHFSYAAHDVRVELSTFEERSGRVRFLQSYVSVERSPSRSEIEVARRLMIAVEDGLVSRCGQAELRARVRETCEGEGCE